MAYSTRSKFKIPRPLTLAGDTQVACAINALPPEILSEIFCLRARTLHMGRKERADVICLLLVCKTWRSVGFSTPRLWAKLRWKIGNPKTDYDDLVKWFGRAQGAPKSLVVIPKRARPLMCLCSHPGFECPFEDSTLVKLLALGPKLQHLRITFNSVKCWSTLTRAVSTLNGHKGSRTWDCLTSLTLEVSVSGASESARPSPFEQLPPKLEVLHLYLRPSEVPLPLVSQFGVPPGVLAGLKKFTISCDWNGPHILALLRHCINAEIVAIESRGTGRHTWDASHPAFPPNISQSTPLILPKVRSLSVHISSPTALTTLLAFLQFPNVVELQVRVPCRPWETEQTFQDALSTFGVPESDSSTGLRSLTLFRPSSSSPTPSSAYLSAQVLFDILAGLPSLTHLALKRIKVHMRQFMIINRKFHEGDGAKLLPLLEHLEFVRAGGPSFDLQSVFDFAKSRRKHRTYADHVKFVGPPDSLKKLSFHRCDDPQGYLKDGYRTPSPVVQQLRDVFGIAIEKF